MATRLFLILCFITSINMLYAEEAPPPSQAAPSAVTPSAPSQPATPVAAQMASGDTGISSNPLFIQTVYSCPPAASSTTNPEMLKNLGLGGNQTASQPADQQQGTGAAK